MRKKIYREKAKQLHPDNGGSAQEFDELNKAYKEIETRTTLTIGKYIVKPRISIFSSLYDVHITENKVIYYSSKLVTNALDSNASTIGENYYIYNISHDWINLENAMPHLKERDKIWIFNALCDAVLTLHYKQSLNHNNILPIDIFIKPSTHELKLCGSFFMTKKDDPIETLAQHAFDLYTDGTDLDVWLMKHLGKQMFKDTDFEDFFFIKNTALDVLSLFTQWETAWLNKYERKWVDCTLTFNQLYEV